MPHITSDLTGLQSSPLIISRQYPFEKTRFALALPINISVYECAKQAEKDTTVYGNISETIWIAQSYCAMLQNPAKFPIETVVDRARDCDDKSLLLAGLLSREGYSVACSFLALNRIW